MCPRGTRGAYRKEERVELPKELQKRLVEAAATRFGTFEKLAKKLEIPKSSVHYYRTGRLTLPVSVMERMLELSHDEELAHEVRDAAKTKDRTWANSYAAGIHREMCRDRLRLPAREELERDDGLRRKAAAIVSYIMAEGSIWIKHNRFDAGLVNITFADHETDLYEHFRSLCRDVFAYDIGPPQRPGNEARAIRGFICSRFVAEWLLQQGVAEGEKSAKDMHLPAWVMESTDPLTAIAALQPWCDGEGTVTGSGGSHGFVLSQSRHTSLTDDDIQGGLSGEFHRSIYKGTLERVRIGDLSAIDCCRTSYRSAVIDDISRLCAHLGLSPRTDVARLTMKGDGRWSCIWTISFRRKDACVLRRVGAITQSRKRSAFDNNVYNFI